MRSACPPIMYPCRYLNFSRGNSAMDPRSRAAWCRSWRATRAKSIWRNTPTAAPSAENACCMRSARSLAFDSLSYQSLDGLLEAIGIDRDKVCTYCWTGKE